MSKEKFDRGKPHINIGTIGYKDEGSEFILCNDKACEGDVIADNLDQANETIKKLTVGIQHLSLMHSIGQEFIDAVTPEIMKIKPQSVKTKLLRARGEMMVKMQKLAEHNGIKREGSDE